MNRRGQNGDVHEQNHAFEILLSGGNVSVADYCHAMSAPKSALPKLTEVQKFVVKKMGIPEEEYRRGVLADQLGDRRMEAQARKLGEVVQAILDESNAGHKVKRVRSSMVALRPLWHVAVTGVNAEIPINEWNIDPSLLGSEEGGTIKRSLKRVLHMFGLAESVEKG